MSAVNHQNQIRVELENHQARVITQEGGFLVTQTGKSDALASCPMYLMLGALGSCIMLTLDAVARHKQIHMTHPVLFLDYDRNQDGDTCFRVDLKLDPDLTDREQKILYHSARACEVGKILKSDVRIKYALLEPSPSLSSDPEAADASGQVPAGQTV